MDVRLNLFQSKLLLSEERIILCVAGIGSGKTFAGGMKLWSHCEQYPNSLALLLRKQQTDAFGSTLKDYKQYFGATFDSNNEYHFKNGSVIIAKPASDIQSLSNYNLSFCLVEQAEELDEETIHAIRNRLRRQTSPYQQLVLLANANGHDFLWKMFIQGADSINVIDEETKQTEYRKGSYYAITASTWANKENLGEGFLKDLESMKKDAPAHYARMVENSFEEEMKDDLVFPVAELEIAKKVDYVPRQGYGYQILGVDPALMGNDNIGVVVIRQLGALHWEVTRVEEWHKLDAVQLLGRVNEIIAQERIDSAIVDCDGLGAPISHFLSHTSNRTIEEFKNTTFGFETNQFYGNRRSECAFKLKDMIKKGYLKIKDEKILTELNSAFLFKYTPRGQRILVSKTECRKLGIPSPGIGDALVYCMELINGVKDQQDRQYAHQNQPQYSSSKNWDPFAPTDDSWAGFR